MSARGGRGRGRGTGGGGFTGPGGNRGRGSRGRNGRGRGRGRTNCRRARRQEQREWREASKGLTNDQKRQLHDAITGEGLTPAQIVIDRNTFFPRNTYPSCCIRQPPSTPPPTP